MLFCLWPILSKDKVILLNENQVKDFAQKTHFISSEIKVLDNIFVELRAIHTNDEIIDSQ
jgi:hypothetical protein